MIIKGKKMKIKVEEGIEEYDYSHLLIDGKHALCDTPSRVRKTVNTLINTGIRPIELRIEEKR